MRFKKMMVVNCDISVWRIMYKLKKLLFVNGKYHPKLKLKLARKDKK